MKAKQVIPCLRYADLHSIAAIIVFRNPFLIRVYFTFRTIFPLLPWRYNNWICYGMDWCEVRYAEFQWNSFSLRKRENKFLHLVKVDLKLYGGIYGLVNNKQLTRENNQIVMKRVRKDKKTMRLEGEAWKKGRWTMMFAIVSAGNEWKTVGRKWMWLKKPSFYSS